MPYLSYMVPTKHNTHTRAHKHIPRLVLVVGRARRAVAAIARVASLGLPLLEALDQVEQERRLLGALQELVFEQLVRRRPLRAHVTHIRSDQSYASNAVLCHSLAQRAWLMFSCTTSTPVTVLHVLLLHATVLHVLQHSTNKVILSLSLSLSLPLPRDLSAGTGAGTGTGTQHEWRRGEDIQRLSYW